MRKMSFFLFSFFSFLTNSEIKLNVGGEKRALISVCEIVIRTLVCKH